MCVCVIGILAGGSLIPNARAHHIKRNKSKRNSKMVFSIMFGTGKKKGKETGIIITIEQATIQVSEVSGIRNAHAKVSSSVFKHLSSTSMAWHNNKLIREQNGNREWG